MKGIILKKEYIIMVLDYILTIYKSKAFTKITLYY